uniref:Uncharacterized protein n=1 Tax=Arundo donax TaxID=35708 RepID=A0A0A8YWQ6_ARUDO
MYVIQIKLSRPTKIIQCQMHARCQETRQAINVASFIMC